MSTKTRDWHFDYVDIRQSDVNLFLDDMGLGYFFLVQHKTLEIIPQGP